MDYLNLFNHAINNLDKPWYGLHFFRGTDKRCKVKILSATTNGSNMTFSYKNIRYYATIEANTFWLKQVDMSCQYKYSHSQGIILK